MSLDVYLTCKHCNHQVFSANITHNLGAMAQEAGIYGVVWRPEENRVSRAYDLVLPLRQAVEQMELDPTRFRKHDAANGWGTYKDFLPWLRRYLEACEQYPDCRVEASR